MILSPAHGVPSLCAVSLDNIATVPKTWLEWYLVAIDADTMSDVFHAIRFVFAMP